MLDEGRYTAIADNYEFGLTSTGKRNIRVDFKIVDGPFEGQTVPWFGYFTEKTQVRTLEALRTAGWQGNSLADLGELGSRVSIVVEQETFEGKTYDRVRWVNPVRTTRSRGDNALAADELDRFAAEMESLAASIPEVGEGESLENTPF